MTISSAKGQLVATLVVVMLSCLLHGSSADFNPNWCTQTMNSSGIMFPNLPMQFQLTVEDNTATTMIKNYTSEYEEYYDFVNNRAAIFYFSNFLTTRDYLLFDTSELITIRDDDCFVNPLNSSEGIIPVGFIDVNSTNHLLSPTFVIKLGADIPTEYKGTDVARGINVNKWYSCSYIPNLASTVRITWSFSDPASWQSTIVLNNQSVSVPVETVIEGITDFNLTWNRRFEFVKYRPYIEADPEIFETPRGKWCPGRKATKPVPKVPSRFSYRIEATIPEVNVTTSQSEWYDFESNLARLDYQPLIKEDIDVLGQDPVTEIHDFNMGVRFIFDRKTDRCINITQLDPSSVDANVGNSSQYVRIRTALEMFHFDKVNYQYHGSRRVRDIDCDVWIAKRTDFPPGQNRTSTWEWYFMASSWVAFNSGKNETNVPVQLVVTQYFEFGTIYITTTQTYNYFDFKLEKPDIFSFGLERCYNGAGSKHLKFTINDVSHDSISDMHEFKHKILEQISKVSYLLPTRIDAVEVDFQDGNANVYFKILEKSPVVGNVENPVQQISLSDAYDLLVKSIKEGKFMFNFDKKDYTVNSESLADVNAKYSTPDKKSPFSDKMVLIAIIGSAFGALVVGIVATALFAKIRSNKSRNMPTLSMSGIMNRD